MTAILLGLSHLFAALAQRLEDRALASSTPSGGKLSITIRREWETRAPVEMSRDAEGGVVVWAGGRFLRIKR